MPTIQDIVSDVDSSYTSLLNAIKGLSHRELTTIHIYPGWTVKDVLAHIIGWDQRVIQILPLIQQGQDLPGVDVAAQNHQAIQVSQHLAVAEIVQVCDANHRQILDLIRAMDYRDIDVRHQRGEQVITIRSYVIDKMTEHKYLHAFEISQWRKHQEAQIDPIAIQTTLKHNQAEVWAALEGLPEDKLLKPGVMDGRSVKDIVAHLADWDSYILAAGRHIYNPVYPKVTPDPVESRGGWTWLEVRRYLEKTQMAFDTFIADLTPGDWKLRGPYPWPNDQGTLAELISQSAEHYASHLPTLRAWRAQQVR